MEYKGSTARVIYVTQDTNIHGGIEEVTRLFMQRFPHFLFFFAISGRTTEWQYRLYYLMAYIRFFVKLLTYRPSAVHVNIGAVRDFVRNIPYVLLPKLFRIPVILQPHLEVDWEFKKFPRPVRAIVRWAIRRADRYVFLTVTHEKLFRQFKPNARTAVVPNAVPEQFFQHIPLSYEQRKHKVIYLGRFHSQKGTDILLKAANAHLSEDPHVLYELHGYGPIRGNGSKRLIMGHWLGLSEKIRLIREAKVMVLPSREEAFGLLIPEAMACGTPVVASNVGGIPDVMADGVHGRLVQAENVERLLEGIKSVLDDPARWEEYSRCGQVKALQYGEEAVFSRWEQVYQEAQSRDTHVIN